MNYKLLFFKLQALSIKKRKNAKNACFIGFYIFIIDLL
ncbi:hypothetical protein RV11_GL001717 [Enterococcus phoeniculicola]|nr:hypothetical protein RV11_GL001717 [Enterococcus phoeniculicola]